MLHKKFEAKYNHSSFLIFFKINHQAKFKHSHGADENKQNSRTNQTKIQHPIKNLFGTLPEAQKGRPSRFPCLLNKALD
jgi:hypothetical protein